MPCLYLYKCNKCDYSLGFGPYPSEKPIKARTGFDSECLCLTCLKQGNDRKAEAWRYYYSYLGLLKRGFRIERDKKKCPFCNSTNVRTVKETLDGIDLKTCPKCKKGTLGEIIAHISEREEKRVKLRHLH